MVNIHNSISVCNSIDQNLRMANCVNSGDLYSKSRHSNNSHRNKRTSPSSPNCLKIPACDRSRWAAIVDVVILIAVIFACGYLLFPYIKLVTLNLIGVLGAVFYLVKEEIARNPIIYGSIGISISCVAMAAWIILLCTSRKCGNPNCKGLRKAAEFDIQLETEECVKNSSNLISGGGLKRGLFELPRDHHRELEAELKRMAPPNGRAVLVFRARCGCSVGRLEVPGPKKLKKMKK